MCVLASPENLNYAGAYLPMSGTAKAWLGSTTASELVAGVGNTELFGNGTNEQLIGGLGDDTFVIYGAEQVVEKANQGINTISSYYTNVDLPSNVENLFVHGNFYAYGNAEANVIVGDSGNQVIDGGPGNDVLTGGGGHDTFVFDAGSGRDVITDFIPGEGSVVRLSGYGQLTSFSQVRTAMSQIGADVVLKLDATDSVTFRNTSVAQFSASDFLLGIDPANKQRHLRMIVDIDFP